MLVPQRRADLVSMVLNDEDDLVHQSADLIQRVLQKGLAEERD